MKVGIPKALLYYYYYPFWKKLFEVLGIETIDLSTRSRLDGNNVDIDIEMGNLAKNTIQYHVLAQRISDHFNKLKTVIRDGR